MSAKQSKQLIHECIDKIVTEAGLKGIAIFHVLDLCADESEPFGRARRNDLLEILESVIGDLLSNLVSIPNLPVTWTDYLTSGEVEVDFLKTTKHSGSKNHIGLLVTLDLTKDACMGEAPPDGDCLEFIGLSLGYMFEILYQSMGWAGTVRIHLNVDDEDPLYLESLEGDFGTGSFCEFRSPEIGLISAIVESDASLPDLTNLVDLPLSRAVRKRLNLVLPTMLRCHTWTSLLELCDVDIPRCLLDTTQGKDLHHPGHFVIEVFERTVRFLLELVWGVTHIRVVTKVEFRSVEEEEVIMMVTPLERMSLPRLARFLKEFEKANMFPLTLDITWQADEPPYPARRTDN